MIKRPLLLISSHNLKTFHEQSITLSLPDPYDEFSGRKTIFGLHQKTELNMLLSPEFTQQIGKKFTLINYKQLLSTKNITLLNAVYVEKNPTN